MGLLIPEFDWVRAVTDNSPNDRSRPFSFGRASAVRNEAVALAWPTTTSGRRHIAKQIRLLERPVWKKPLAVTGIALLTMWILIAIFAPWLAPMDPYVQDSARYLPPGREHWFGTDRLGRDVLSRIIYGARITLPYAVVLVIGAGSVGVVLGSIAGYFGGVVDEAIMRLTDLVFAFPTIILAMAVTATLGPNLRNAVIAIIIVQWPSYARVARSFVLTQRDMDYISASRLAGASARRTLTTDMVPNLAGPMVVLAMLEVGNAVLLLAGLSFLGLGAQPPLPEWGRMVADGAAVLDRWWIGTFSGLAILSVVLSFNLIGDTLRDIVDPRVGNGAGRNE